MSEWVEGVGSKRWGRRIQIRRFGSKILDRRVVAMLVSVECLGLGLGWGCKVRELSRERRSICFVGGRGGVVVNR